MLASPNPSCLWCAIPVYNNAATVREVACRARQQLEHVLVVDDGSTDADLCELLGDVDITLITHKRNRGKGRALLTAMRYATKQGAEYMVALDADGQHFPEDIPQLLPHLTPHTIVIGRRARVEGSMPDRSEFGRTFSDFWIHLETGVTVRDSQCGFRAYPLPAVRQLPLRAAGYHFEVEVITRALWAGLQITDAPVGVWYAAPEQRVSSFRPFRDNLRLALLHTGLLLRQAAPWPHRRLPDAPTTAHPRRTHVPMIPLALAAAAALGVLTAALPWVLPRLLLLLWLTWRWHLHKPLALACHGLGLLPIIPWACTALGLMLLGRSASAATWSWWPYPTAAWYPWLVGSWLIGPALGAAAALLSHRVARRFIRREADT